MTQLLLNAGITGPITESFDFQPFLTLPPALNPVGRSLRFRNVHNCKAEQFNEDNTNLTLDCRDHAGPRPVNLDTGSLLSALYPYAQEEFEELVFSETYCAEVGPLPLFLRRKVIQSRMVKAEKEKSAKDKSSKPIQGSMIMDKPLARVPGRRPAVVVPNIFLHAIANKLYPPLNWFTNDRLEFTQHRLHELHTKLIRPEASVDNPSPDKILVFDMTRMITLWGSDESSLCLSPLKWQEASTNLLSALSTLSESLSPVEMLTRFTFAGEFAKHHSFFIDYGSFEEHYNLWYAFEREARHDIFQGTLFDNSYYVQQVDGRLRANVAVLSALSPPSSPTKRPSDTDLCSNSKVARSSNDSPGSVKLEAPSTPRALRSPGSSFAATCISCAAPHKLREHPLGVTTFSDGKVLFSNFRDNDLWSTKPFGSFKAAQKICIDYNLPRGCKRDHDPSRLHVCSLCGKEHSSLSRNPSCARVTEGNFRI